MSDPDTLTLILRFLTAPCGTATPEQVIAWEDFYHIHDRMIRNLIKRCDPGQIETDDLAQGVWYTMIRRLRTYDAARGTLRNWVLTIARNLARKHARRKSRDHDEPFTTELVDALLDREADPVTECARIRQRERVRAVLEKLGARLPKLNRQIMVLRWIEERSVSDISTQLNVAEGHVWAILREVKRKLPRLLCCAGLGPSEEN